MNDTDQSVVLSGRARLARNYYDLPFPNLLAEKGSDICSQRAIDALDKEGYQTVFLFELSKEEQLELVEDHLISRDLLQNGNVGTALIRDDKQVCVMVNEEDHLRIQAIIPGLDLQRACDEAFAAEAKLQAVCRFSFDPQLGYLTACPTNTGTGMRASLMLHLPMLTRLKQMGNVSQSVAKLGLTMRGIYGEGSEALGDLYQVSNQVTLGRTEKELVEAVMAVGKQLISMEQALRDTTLKQKPYDFEDVVYRSYGVLESARQMDVKEFMLHWSNLRMGAACGLLPVSLDTADRLLTMAQNAHAQRRMTDDQPELTVNRARCQIIRELLTIKQQEE